MQVIPLQAIPNQSLQCTLANQQVELAVYQTDYGLFIDVASDGNPVVTGVLIEDKNRIVRDAYFGFAGDLEFLDTSGESVDPVYTGLGSQFLLIYLETSDLEGL